MPIISVKQTPDGLEPLDYSGAKNLSDVARLEPDGIYDVARIFPGCQAVLLDSHFNRMERSLAMLGLDIDLDRPRLRESIRNIFHQSGYVSTRLRLCVPIASPEEVHIVLEDFQEYGSDLPKLKETGVVVHTQRVKRETPLAKTIRWVKERMKFEETLLHKPYENIILNRKNELLEGFSSNFYSIIGSTIHTSKGKVLPGIARKIVFKIAEAEYEIIPAPLKLDQILNIDEAFLTSSSRGIVPIIQIDDVIIGDGKPGAGTKALIKSYNDWVDAHLESI